MQTNKDRVKEDEKKFHQVLYKSAFGRTFVQLYPLCNSHSLTIFDCSTLIIIADRPEAIVLSSRAHVRAIAPPHARTSHA